MFSTQFAWGAYTLVMALDTNARYPYSENDREIQNQVRKFEAALENALIAKSMTK